MNPGELDGARVAVLVPVKSFTQAKLRLAPVLPAAEREELARSMAAAVLRAADGLPVSVVCDDDVVASWAVEHGASVLWCPGLGLNGAVTEGVGRLAEEGFDTVIVSHADLPLATELAWVAAFDGVTLVPDRRDDGTNVLALPAHAPFRFSYGPGSFAHHDAEARRLDLPVRVVRDRRLGWDVDIPEDLPVPC